MICERATDEAIRRAAQAIRDGGLAAFPTETVYGLGADAFNPQAVRQVYEIKGRPADNPLILHVNTPETAAALVEMDARARTLMDAFWPGPLTLVLRKSASLPGWVGGHPANNTETIAVRSPNHPVARALISYAGCAIAAPSANKAGTPSPTQAAHVAVDFAKESLFLLDGGDVPGGLESTVVDLTGDNPAILRPGAITAKMLHDVLGCPVTAELTSAPDMPDAPRSPGMKYRHYAPRAPITLVAGEPEQAAAYIIAKVGQAGRGGLSSANRGGLSSANRGGLSSAPRSGILATAQTALIYKAHFNTRIGDDIFLLTMGDRETPSTIAQGLYACLRQFDSLGVDIIYAEGVSEDGLGAAIMNRLVKAAGGEMVCVSRV